jgi:uncharacterized protein
MDSWFELRKDWGLSLAIKYPVRLFLALTFGISTIVFATYQWIPDAFLTLYFAVAMWVPGLVALGIRKVQGVKIQPSVLLVWENNRYLWLAAVTPFVLVALTTVFNILLTPSVFAIDPFYVNAFNEIGVPENMHLAVLIGQAVINGFLAGITINTFFALGEEIGWRGFLQKELSHLGLWKSGLLIGFIWGLWHAPLVIQGYNFPQKPTSWCLHDGGGDHAVGLNYELFCRPFTNRNECRVFPRCV